MQEGVDSFLRVGLRNFRLLFELQDEFFPFRKQRRMFGAKAVKLTLLSLV